MPSYFAKTLTYPQPVTPFNYAELSAGNVSISSLACVISTQTRMYTRRAHPTHLEMLFANAFCVVVLCLNNSQKHTHAHTFSCAHILTRTHSHAHTFSRAHILTRTHSHARTFSRPQACIQHTHCSLCVVVICCSFRRFGHPDTQKHTHSHAIMCTKKSN